MKLYKMLLACAVAGTLTACSTQTGAPGAADTTKAAGETGSAEAEKAPWRGTAQSPSILCAMERHF